MMSIKNDGEMEMEKWEMRNGSKSASEYFVHVFILQPKGIKQR